MIERRNVSSRDSRIFRDIFFNDTQKEKLEGKVFNKNL